jgi:hypothetical protein
MDCSAISHKLGEGTFRGTVPVITSSKNRKIICPALCPWWTNKV